MASTTAYNYSNPASNPVASQVLRQASSASARSRTASSKIGTISRPLIRNDQDATPGSSTRESTHSSMMSAPLEAYDGPVLKSQYPADSMENHVEYILVASFDIDRGSVMEHQYPGPISGDEHMLAELMLPDQAHVRSQDWTIFFLHKDMSAEEDAREERRRQRRLKRRKKQMEENGETIPKDEDIDLEGLDLEDDGDGDSSSDEDDVEGPPLIYVLNLVNTKQDQTVKRCPILSTDNELS